MSHSIIKRVLRTFFFYLLLLFFLFRAKQNPDATNAKSVPWENSPIAERLMATLPARLPIFMFFFLLLFIKGNGSSNKNVKVYTINICSSRTWRSAHKREPNKK